MVDGIYSSVVGESYIKFDSNSPFYPTLLFKFKHKKKLGIKRYSQIQTRLLKNPDEITDQVISALKKSAEPLRNLDYFSGPVRCNYIAPNRLFKTTLFTQTEDECLKVLEKVIPLGLTTFVPGQFSITSQNQRIPYTRASKSPNFSIKLNPTIKLAVCEMRLNSIYLQVNGWDKMVKLL
uniref:Uncharacterized protein n=1 Tax=Sarcinofilum mucosum TaxID=141643 RepID=A0A1W6EGE0_SARMC|nr:hypothetical protein [Sarcinofilum mucosum]ARK14463.1 hypothetical protein [Sarcinofilum mucosum]